MRNNTVIDRRRQRQSINTMYFNRFLAIRYLMAVSFFINLYMLIFTFNHSLFAFIPGTLIILSIGCIFQLFKMNGGKKPRINLIEYCFKSNFIMNIFALVIAIFIRVSSIIPYFTDLYQTKIIIITIYLVQVFISYISLNRLNKIKNNKDKQFSRIKKYEKILKI